MSKKRSNLSSLQRLQRDIETHRYGQCIDCDKTLMYPERRANWYRCEACNYAHIELTLAQGARHPNPEVRALVLYGSWRLQ